MWLSIKMLTSFQALLPQVMNLIFDPLSQIYALFLDFLSQKRCFYGHLPSIQAHLFKQLRLNKYFKYLSI